MKAIPFQFKNFSANIKIIDTREGAEAVITIPMCTISNKDKNDVALDVIKRIKS